MNESNLDSPEDHFPLSEKEPSTEDVAQEDFSDGKPAGKMFLSFLLVGSSFLLLFMSLAFCYFVLASFIAPEAIELFKEKPEVFNKKIAEDPGLLWPSEVVYGFLVIGTLVAALFGAGVTFFARFSKTAHGGILALVTFVTLLQMSLSKPLSPQWVINACMLLFPLAILIGGHLRSRCCS